MSIIPVNSTAVERPSQFSTAELDTLKRTIGHDLDDNEFELFAAICRRTGLDPFARQIYAVKRWDARQRREVMQIQTGIDGYRTIAERSNNYAGPAPTYWCGPDGKWVDVWLSDKPPAAAKAGVYRKDFAEPVYVTAKFSSYVAKNKDGKPMALWATMPEVMIAKCAEALAIRKAFPNDVSGVYTKEELAQQDNTPAQVSARTKNAEGVSSVAAPPPPAAAPSAQPAPDPAAPEESSPSVEPAASVSGVVGPAPAGGTTAPGGNDATGGGEPQAQHPASNPAPGGGAESPGPSSPGSNADDASAHGASPSGPAPTPLKELNASAYQSIVRFCRGVQGEYFGADSDVPKDASDEDVIAKQPQWASLMRSCTGGRTIRLSEAGPEEATVFRRRCQDFKDGLCRWVESADPAWLGWALEYGEAK